MDLILLYRGFVLIRNRWKRHVDRQFFAIDDTNPVRMAGSFHACSSVLLCM